MASDPDTANASNVADLIFTPAMEGTDGAQRVARSMAEAAPDRYWYFDQYNNEVNRRAHFETTGPEIHDQTCGCVTHFVACLGPTGTFVGVGRYVRSKNPSIYLVAVQPDSSFHGIEGVKHLEMAKVSGIWDLSLPDQTMTVATEDAQAAAWRLAREGGYLVGTSRGAALDAGLRLAERIREGVIVMVFPDAGDKYLGDHYWEEAV